jgi:DNA-binding transcriptional MerR regulator
MRIGEVARRAGVSAAAIRFYEREGLLPAPERDDNTYRDYTETDAERAVTFVQFRAIGLELADAAKLADQCATGQCDLTWAELPPLIERQRAAIAERIADLRILDSRLAALQASATEAGQPDPSRHDEGKEVPMLHCDCDGGCCGGGSGPCC